MNRGNQVRQKKDTSSRVPTSAGFMTLTANTHRLLFEESNKPSNARKRAKQVQR